MVDISNKSLALLLVVAIIFSFGGTLMMIDKLAGVGPSIQGMATGQDTGTARLVINANVTVTFTVNDVNWGIGYVNNTNQAGTDYCVMDSESTLDSNCINFSTVANGFRIRNDGNVNVSLQLVSDSNAAAFLGGTSPAFEWKLTTVGGDDGCPTALRNSTFDGTFTDVSTTDVYACGSDSGSDFWFNFEDAADSIDLDVNVSVPENAPTGSKTATITATGTSA